MILILSSSYDKRLDVRHTFLLSNTSLYPFRFFSEKMRFLFVSLCLPAFLSASGLASQPNDKTLAPSIAKGLLFLRDDDFMLSGSKWEIAVDINLNDYRHVIQHFFESVKRITTFIGEPTAQTKDVHNALRVTHAVIVREIDSLTAQAKLIDAQFESLVYTLTPKASRPRRGLIDLGGNILNFLFGTLDANDLQDVHTRIQSINRKADGVLHLMTEQISFGHLEPLLDTWSHF